MATFWTTFGKIRQLFILAYGHSTYKMKLLKVREFESTEKIDKYKREGPQHCCT